MYHFVDVATGQPDAHLNELLDCPSADVEFLMDMVRRYPDCMRLTAEPTVEEPARYMLRGLRIVALRKVQ